MPEYVYALHDFQPEHEDEIAFRAGQPIEVLEKDDQYNDGWWQGRNLEGKIGLFPQSYTTPAAPVNGLSASSSTSSTDVPLTTPSNPLQSLQEEPDSSSFRDSDADSKIGIAIGEPVHGQGEVMKATMTDVQKAIEQLGRNDRDGAQSFSFSSTHGDTDRDTDGTETDGEIGVGDGGEGWHRSARNKLAEQARKVVEAKAAAEDLPVRSPAPPIEVEMSDESEGEDDDDAFHHLQHMHFTREHPHIPEEDEEDEARRNSVLDRDHRRHNSNETSSAILPREDLSPAEEDSGERTAKANQATFTSADPPPRSTRSPVPSEKRSPQLLPTPTSPHTHITAFVPIAPVDKASISKSILAEPVAQVTPSVTREVREVSNALPSPALTSAGTQHGAQQASKHNSIASTGKISIGSSQSPHDMDPVKKSTPPSEWSVDEVVDWLRSKGFGPDVCDKFIEQEITGDVLLELDINLLKAEIGIVAFGKRMRIANAIAELRRPPSIIFTDQQSPQMHSRTHSQSISHSASQSYSYTHSPSGSTQLSLNSPLYVTSMAAAMNSGSAPLGPVGRESPKPEATANTAMPKRVSSLSSAAVSLNGGSVESNSVATGVERAAVVGMVGLGLGVSRSGQLVPSPSDGALNKRGQVEVQEQHEPAEDERDALSEGESAPSTSKQRRRLFGRSVESSLSGQDKCEPTNGSKDRLAPSPATASPRPQQRGSLDDSSAGSRQSRPKRSGDSANKGSERLSLFGGAFPTTIGKSRKPPPRITSTILDDSPQEKSSSLSLSRLYGRKASGRPSTSDGSATSTLRNGSSLLAELGEEKSKEKAKVADKLRDDETLKAKEPKPTEPKDRSSPRKQNGAVSQDGGRSGSRGPSALKPGKSIIEQIGRPDHEGWMRKKGDHYNSWKVRYFIIKGPHLYILRSNNKAETKIKGYVNIVGYKVIADENIDPGRYGFRIVHETDKTHYFSSDEQGVVREWMKAIMKATIGRDYSKPVVSSVNIPTIPLTVAQAMNPAPRPPSPTARAAMQKALRRENPNQLSTRDARILMGLPSPDNGVRTDDPQESERMRLDSFFANQSVSGDASEAGTGSATPKASSKSAPPRPSREARRASVTINELMDIDDNLIDWANSHLPKSLQVDPTGPLFGGLAILRVAEDMMGKPASPPIPDSAFPTGPNDDKLDGLFRLFDFLLDNDVKMGTVSINDVRQGKREKVLQLLKALKAWEDRRKDIVRSIGVGAGQGTAFMATASWR